MILVTTYYISENEARNEEIKLCLQKNYENKNITSIYLLNNKIYDLKYTDKVIQVIISNDIDYKLKYNDAIHFINDYLKDNICILANSDIYFDDSLLKINKNTIHNNFFALLRYDDNVLFSRHGSPRNDSQDSWIFESPLNIDINKLDFSFGTLGCDNMFASYVNDANILKISNPCYDIISNHVHGTNYRTYNDDYRINGKYCLITPCSFGELPDLNFMDY